MQIERKKKTNEERRKDIIIVISLLSQIHCFNYFVALISSILVKVILFVSKKITVLVDVVKPVLLPFLTFSQ